MKINKMDHISWFTFHSNLKHSKTLGHFSIFSNEILRFNVNMDSAIMTVFSLPEVPCFLTLGKAKKSNEGLNQGVNFDILEKCPTDRQAVIHRYTET